MSPTLFGMKLFTKERNIKHKSDVKRLDELSPRDNCRAENIEDSAVQNYKTLAQKFDQEE